MIETKYGSSSPGPQTANKYGFCARVWSSNFLSPVLSWFPFLSFGGWVKGRTELEEKGRTYTHTPVLQKPRNIGDYNYRQKPYLQKIFPILNTSLTFRGNCLQIWPLSGIGGSSIPGFLQDLHTHTRRQLILLLFIVYIYSTVWPLLKRKVILSIHMQQQNILLIFIYKLNIMCIYVVTMIEAILSKKVLHSRNIFY